ncbi:MAG TPA: flagellar protein FlgN [Bauldia sp.]|nr:flagellar protein FlgN [Bauldia sp.]
MQPTGHAAVAALSAAMARLEEAIDAETEALEARRPVDLEALNRLKSRSLLELTRLARTLPPAGNAGLAAAVAGLTEKLVRNQAVLRLHLDAVQEISGLLAHALGEAESDGTYGLAPRRAGP